MKISSVPISFRLDSEIVSILDHYCQRTGLSRGAACRTLAVSCLTGGDSANTGVLLEEIRSLLSRQQSTLQRQQRLLAYSLLTLLTHLGQLPPADAAALVRSTLVRSERSEEP